MIHLNSFDIFAYIYLFLNCSLLEHCWRSIINNKSNHYESLVYNKCWFLRFYRPTSHISTWPRRPSHANIKQVYWRVRPIHQQWKNTIQVFKINLKQTQNYSKKIIRYWNKTIFTKLKTNLHCTVTQKIQNSRSCSKR